MKKNFWTAIVIFSAAVYLVFWVCVIFSLLKIMNLLRM